MIYENSAESNWKLTNFQSVTPSTSLIEKVRLFSTVSMSSSFNFYHFLNVIDLVITLDCDFESDFFCSLCYKSNYTSYKTVLRKSISTRKMSIKSISHLNDWKSLTRLSFSAYKWNAESFNTSWLWFKRLYGYKKVLCKNSHMVLENEVQTRNWSEYTHEKITARLDQYIDPVLYLPKKNVNVSIKTSFYLHFIEHFCFYLFPVTHFHLFTHQIFEIYILFEISESFIPKRYIHNIAYFQFTIKIRRFGNDFEAEKTRWK